MSIATAAPPEATASPQEPSAAPAERSTGARRATASPSTSSPKHSPSPPHPNPPSQPIPPSSAPHIKTHHSCSTPDGWRLHLVRTRTVSDASVAADAVGGAATAVPPYRCCPVVLCPGLGSSGAYTFDLSPVVSLADYLAARGWDVWTVELRGNGQSDRPRLFVRSRWWTIDDYVTKDLPAVLQYVRQTSGSARLHVLGHSMGGMILTRLLALGGEAAECIASATVVGSGCFLKGSWWQALEHTMWLARFLWLVPAGATLRAYSPLALGRAGLAAVDQLYFSPPNTDPALARAVLARNFSAISSGVILQFGSAFGPRGLRTADGRQAYADPELLSRVATPVLFICGDRDRMCPAQGAAATCALFSGSRCARFEEVGPRWGTRHHYGHFDILMGKHAEQEVFPRLAAWLDQYDNDDGGGGAAGTDAAGGDAAAVAGLGSREGPPRGPAIRSKL